MQTDEPMTAEKARELLAAMNFSAADLELARFLIQAFDEIETVAPEPTVYEVLCGTDPDGRTRRAMAQQQSRSLSEALEAAKCRAAPARQ